MRIRESLYATITMIAVVVGLAEDAPGVSHADAAWSVCGTAIGLWLAIVVAEQQAHQVVHRHIARGAELRRILYTSSPLLLSAVGPMLFIGVSALGVMRLQTGLLTAICVDLGELFVWGVVSGLRMGGKVLAGLVTGVADVVIGLGIVAVKVFTHR
jgi:hypothetical protein